MTLAGNTKAMGEKRNEVKKGRPWGDLKFLGIISREEDRKVLALRNTRLMRLEIDGR